jgi:hypothetical protein
MSEEEEEVEEKRFHTNPPNILRPVILQHFKLKSKENN